MNKAILMGRLTRDPEIRGEGNALCARFSLAVDRRFKKEGQPDADFINCVSFGKQAEFVEKYLKKGMKIALTGRIQTGSYTNKDGQKIYTTDIITEELDFAEGKKNEEAAPQGDNDFMNVSDAMKDDMPF